MTTTITIKDKAVNTTYQNVTGLQVAQATAPHLMLPKPTVFIQLC